MSHDDAFLFLAQVKTHLANHNPMTAGDAEAWELCDQAQIKVFIENTDDSLTAEEIRALRAGMEAEHGRD